MFLDRRSRSTRNAPPLFRFSKERQQIIDEVSWRVNKHYLSNSRRSEDAGIEYVLNDAAFREITRLATEKGPEDEIRPRSWWLKVSKKLADMSEQKRRDILKELIDSYSEDIAGQFNPSVYELATGALPIGLGMLFKAQDLQDIPGFFPHVLDAVREMRDLSDRLVVDGPLDTLRELAQKGTLLVVPTHSSNMDSILIGYSLFASQLPPVTYGAGKNLFANPMTSFFMHNLGAYKVDRRIRHTLYKEILKTYSQVLLERGYHSLFFPGGTRCRSNVVEDKLKLGLLGTAIGAYTHALTQKREDKRVYIVPLTINYNLVLEAESLIRESLRRKGGSRFILPNDEFNELPTIARFVMNTMRMQSTTILRFGDPLDPFGNRVERDGESYDNRGRRVDPTSYVRCARTGDVVSDAARDREYTRYSGKQIGEAFRKHTVIMPTQLVSYVLFELLRERFPQWDIYRLLRMGGEEVISWEDLRAGTAALIDELRVRAERGEFYLSPFITSERPARVAEEGINYLRMYHIPEAVDFHNEGIRLDRLDLIYFYSNRVRSYAIDDRAWIKAARRV